MANVAVRNAEPGDALVCAEILHAAFGDIGSRHGFGNDFPPPEHGVQVTAQLIAAPSVASVVAEQAGVVVGCVFMLEGDPIRGIGPIAVRPDVQARGVGRMLMQAMLDRARGAPGIRLCQDAYNTASLSLYASLGFDVTEPLLLLRGRPQGPVAADAAVRDSDAADAAGCAALIGRHLGQDRRTALRMAMGFGTPVVAERAGRITGLMVVPQFWHLNFGVAETEADFQALVVGAARTGEVAFLFPSRRTDLLRWLLRSGMRVVKPMTLMATGDYAAPAAPWFPSVYY
jgi:predicted N-acetyltransferase YhbS